MFKYFTIKCFFFSVKKSSLDRKTFKILIDFLYSKLNKYDNKSYTLLMDYEFITMIRLIHSY